MVQGPNYYLVRRARSLNMDPDLLSLLQDSARKGY